MDVDIGVLMRGKREHRGMLAKDVAKAAGISAQFLCDLELGRRIPSPATARAISVALGWPPNHIGHFVVEHYRSLYCMPQEDRP